ncbi:MAG: gliding motility-associated-like protein, partial [Granulosicoccus sp.]
VNVTDANGCSVQVPVDIIEPTELISAFVSQTNLTCNASGDGVFEVSASGATPTYTFDVGAGPQATGIFGSLPTGLHTVTIIDANLCQTTIDVSLIEPTVVTSFIVSQTDPLCNGGSGGEFEVSASGGTPVYTYDLGTGAQSSGVFQGLAVGMHTVDILDANGCPNEITVTLTEPSALTGAITMQTGASCAGIADGSVTVEAADGTAGYTYDIGGGSQATGAFSGLLAGNYTVVITDAHGCTINVPVIITEPISLSASIQNQTAVSCFEGADGSVEIIAQDGTPPFTFDIGAGPQATGLLIGLTVGSYIVNVTDANGCAVDVSVDIIEPTELISAFVSQSNLTCNASGDGAFEVSAAGATPAYTFDIGVGTQATGIFNSLLAGLHTVTIIDANLCQTTIDVTLTEPTVVISSIVGQTDPLCNAGIDGEFEVLALGGTPTYTYDLGTDAQASGVFQGLAAGIHTVDILDANGCPNQIIVTLDEPTALSGSITAQVDVSCAGFADGSVTVDGSTGTPPYTYDIGSGAQVAGNYTGLVAGAYTVTITDGHDCTFDVPVIIMEPVSLSAAIASQTDVICFGTATGTVAVSAQDGTPPYTFDIGNGPQATGDFVNILVGNYTVEVVDANGCATQVSVEMIEPDLLVGSIDNITNVSCFGGSDGEVTVSALGGITPYSFDIGAGGQASGIFSSLFQSAYTIDITDANGCVTYLQPIVTEPTQLLASISDQVEVSCFGTATGSVIISASEGTSPYSYDIGDGPQTTGEFNALIAGNYTVTVVDDHGCLVDVQVTITEPPVLTGSIIYQQNVLCSGTATGEATIEGAGGTLPYTFNIGTGLQTTGAFYNLLAGLYQVTIEDAKGCQFLVNVEILEPNPLLGVIDAQVNVSCNGLADGSVEILATGGTPPFVFDLGIGSQPSGIFSNLIAGNYNVLITDANGCEFEVPFEITEPMPLSGGIDNQMDVTCFGGSDAMVTVFANGGTTPYTFDIGLGSQATGVFTGLASGAYTILISDANLCTYTVGVTIIEPTQLVVSVTSITEPLCNGDDNGQIVFDATGATAPYLFDIGNGTQSTGIFNGLAANNYTCTVIDANGCLANATATMDQPPPLQGVVIDVSDVLCYGYSDGTILVDAMGGTGAYTFEIGAGPQLFGAFTDLIADTYYVAIMDENLCIDTLEIEVNEPPMLEATLVSVTDVLCAGEPSGAFEIQAFGGSPDYVYSIGGGAMPGGVFTGLYGGTYDLLITDDHTCQLITLIDVDVPNPISIAIGVPVSTFCAGQQISLSTSVSGGVTSYTFEWFEVIGQDTTSVSTDSIPNLTLNETAVFFLEVIDANGCSETSFDVLINVYPSLELNVITPIDGTISVCPGEEVPITISGFGGNGNFTYYSMPDHVEIIGFPTTYLADTDSILSFQVEDRCSAQPGLATVNVTLFEIPELLIHADSTVNCPVMEVNFSDATTPPLSDITWSFNDGTPNENGLSVTHSFEESGFFDISVVALTADGCPAEASFEDFINVWPVPDADFGATADTVSLYEATIGFTDQSLFNIQSWYWEFDDGEIDVVQNPSHVYQDTGRYFVHLEVTNDYGCVDSIDHMVYVIPEFAFWVPNAFTPDNDGLNDSFTGEGDGVNWEEYDMQIFDRWGELIYQTNDINAPWNGYYKGTLVEMGVYVYKIKVAELRGAKHYYDGQFTFLR